MNLVIAALVIEEALYGKLQIKGEQDIRDWWPGSDEPGDGCACTPCQRYIELVDEAVKEA